jgi:hypothetical protein
MDLMPYIAALIGAGALFIIAFSVGKILDAFRQDAIERDEAELAQRKEMLNLIDTRFYSGVGVIVRFLKEDGTPGYKVERPAFSTQESLPDFYESRLHNFALRITRMTIDCSGSDSLTLAGYKESGLGHDEHSDALRYLGNFGVYTIPSGSNPGTYCGRKFATAGMLLLELQRIVAEAQSPHPATVAPGITV